MTSNSTAPVTTGTLQVPGALLHYELRGTGPLVVLVGAPMNATSFAPLADLLAADHTVLTTDPRGINRSTVDDPEQDSTPELRAEDLSRLIAHVGGGPATVLGSSGGAISALALVQAHPEQVRTVVAHEPPLDELLDDREQVQAQTDEIIATHAAGDHVGAWRKFLAQASIELPPGVVEQAFGDDRDPQKLADERFWFARELRATVRWRPDLAALRAAPTRIVVGIGDESAGQSCDRTSRALAAELGLQPVLFPGDHTGFVDDPERFAVRLRAVLGES
ncbi:alpha/beta fold hydrolase [Conexibacter woesei]|uniref:Alpha/beta hydrolase fold protein n=1 Tax=Conexibacter woesei (strain DSM 14684 / CCUG 47730 / CIP 108061 / JCM 11494 / NBRC 100937 / ID131577) TaxID=469383 RepID=D3FDB6_CONWI|nr:alpha/beta hydrolase [Conexibacter woesei]ADB53508.1 alpha/beta hydrolase fold protein [Conexibacter woesei DSM 14684]